MEVRIVEDNRPEALAQLKRKEYTALVAIGVRAVGYARGKCPVYTGRLRASLTYTISDSTVEVSSDVNYAVYQEYGTRYIAGKHFMRDAMAHHINEYIQLIQTILKE